MLAARSLSIRDMTYSSTNRSTFIRNLETAAFAEGGTIHTSGPLVPPAGGTHGLGGTDVPAGMSPGSAAAAPPVMTPRTAAACMTATRTQDDRRSHRGVRPNPGGDWMPVEFADAVTFCWENAMSALFRDFLTYRCMAGVRWSPSMPKRHCAIGMVHRSGPLDEVSTCAFRRRPVATMRTSLYANMAPDIRVRCAADAWPATPASGMRT